MSTMTSSSSVLCRKLKIILARNLQYNSVKLGRSFVSQEDDYACKEILDSVWLELILAFILLKRRSWAK